MTMIKLVANIYPALGHISEQIRPTIFMAHTLRNRATPISPKDFSASFSNQGHRTSSHLRCGIRRSGFESWLYHFLAADL